MKFDSIRLLFSRLNPFSSFAVAGACLYITVFAVPFRFQWDISLIAFSLFSSLSVLSNFRNNSNSNSLFYLLVAVFLVAAGISVLISENIGRSLEFSAPLIPAMLLFFVIAEYSKGAKDIRLIYFAFSIAATGLAVLLLKASFDYSGADPFLWVSAIKSPALAVKNDVVFLSILTPLSLSLFFSGSKHTIRVIALFSVLLSIVVAGTFQSRVAMLTMVISTACFFILLNPRKALAYTFTSIMLLLFVDGIRGFKLIERFINNWDGSGRIPLWLSAWDMFLDAPLSGHGLHTFGLFYSAYLEKLALPSWLFIEKRVVPWPHNLYLEVLAEQGIIGLVSLGLLLSYGLFSAWKSISYAQKETRILGYGVFAALAGFCFAAIFELTFLRRWVVILMFTLLGITAQLSIFHKERR